MNYLIASLVFLSVRGSSGYDGEYKLSNRSDQYLDQKTSVVFPRN